jgi:hypothetical protein
MSSNYLHPTPPPPPSPAVDDSFAFHGAVSTPSSDDIMMSNDLPPLSPTGDDSVAGYKVISILFSDDITVSSNDPTLFLHQQGMISSLIMVLLPSSSSNDVSVV